MRVKMPAAIAAFGALASLAACASPNSADGLSASRSVFHNPYATIAYFEDEMRVSGLFYPGAGRFAFDREGNRVRLTRQELRAVRDRAATVRSTIILREALANGERVAIPLHAPRQGDEEKGGGAPDIEPSPAAPPIAAPLARARTQPPR